MIKPQTVGQLAEWIVKNKKGNAFKDNTLEDIVFGLQEAIACNNILYVTDDDTCEFIGVVLFKPDITNRILFVKNILVTKHSALVTFVRYFEEHFKDFYIAGNRNNEYMQYNTFRLINLLKTIKGGH